ncbi:MAG: protein kinase [Deltaproteobacteria bacterium]|nr:protein kinase [Deltaproteobacteria bacterium]
MGLWHSLYLVAEDDSELEGIPEPGAVIVDKYRVDRVLGVGGMGCVVAATHLTLDQTVAIKFLLAKAARNPNNLTRFQREAQSAAKIRSDHVAKVSDIGTLPDGTPYMVMEYLDGEDLADRLERGAVQAHECVEWVLQACEALAEAHLAGIVHRDLKPANLFLAKLPDGAARVKVLDFGISKIVAAPGAGGDLTKTSALMGSPLYMSPEQMMSAKAADARADIWALGCILFESLTRQPPFIGDTLPEICSKILTSPPSPLQTLAPHTPPELTAVIMRCLEKKPEDRFANLGELATALARFVGEKGVVSARTTRRVLGMPELDDAAFAGAAAGPPVGAQTQAAPSGGYEAIHGAGDATASGAYGAAVPAAGSYTAPQGGAPAMASPGAPAQGAVYGAVSQGAVSQGAVPQGAVSQGAVSQGVQQGGVSQSGPYAVPIDPAVAAQPAISQAGISQGGISQSGVQPAPMGQDPTMCVPDGVQAAPPTVATPPAGMGTTGAQGQAAALGTATAAPVAQTMSEMMPQQRSKLPIVLGILGAAAVLVVLVVVFVSGGSETESSNPAAADTIPVDPPETTAPAASITAAEPDDPATDGSAEPSASPLASAKAPPTPKTTTGQVPTRPKTGTGKTTPTQPGYKVKTGDDQFTVPD